MSKDNKMWLILTGFIAAVILFVIIEQAYLAHAQVIDKYQSECNANIFNNNQAKAALSIANVIFGPDAKYATGNDKISYDCINEIYKQQTGNYFTTSD